MKCQKTVRYALLVFAQIIVLTVYNYSYALSPDVIKPEVVASDVTTSDVTNSNAMNNQTTINWQQWNADVFRQAKNDNKFVLLNLEAVWCHWCHVMDKLTYSEKDVIANLSNNYIAVKVDHDANPGLANKYRNYGWPATIIFDADGNEIVKRAGYIDANLMVKILNAVVENQSSEINQEKNITLPQSIARKGNTLLTDSLRATLIQHHRSAYDEKEGGLKINQKFLDRDSVEYAMSATQQGDWAEARRAKHSLTAALNLLDPAWGGFYQYSTQGDWQHAHYEKIMRVQASYLRLYALAYAQFSDAKYLHATDEIRRYLNLFLKSSNGVYFVSQDADLIQGEHSDDYFALSSRDRYSLGIPKVDKHVYAQENGWVIEALATLYETTGDISALDEALTATAGILEKHYNRRSQGFIHDVINEQGESIYFLGDNLAMARAFLQLYRATAEKRWLTLSSNTTDFIQRHFYASTGGYSGNEDLGLPVKPVPDIDENISLARFTNLLSHYTGDESHKGMSKHAMRFLSREEIATARLTEAGLLLLDNELVSDPLHITVIGEKKDATAAALFVAALNKSGWYKRVEWWDRKEGKLPNADVGYPALNRAAVFLCTDNRCSLPVFSAQALNDLIDEIDNDTLSQQQIRSQTIKLEDESNSILPTVNSFIQYHSEVTSNYASVIF